MLEILRHYHKDSDLTFLQLELRRYLQMSRREETENKNTNRCSINSYRQPVQIKVEVIPVRMNRIERELEEEMERERKKELEAMETMKRDFSVINLEEAELEE